MFGILGSLHFAIAGVVSNVVGGELYAHVGGKKLFLGVGVVCGVWTGVMLVHYNIRRYVRQQNSSNTVVVKVGALPTHQVTALTARQRRMSKLAAESTIMHRRMSVFG